MTYSRRRRMANLWQFSESLAPGFVCMQKSAATVTQAHSSSSCSSARSPHPSHFSADSWFFLKLPPSFSNHTRFSSNLRPSFCAKNVYDLGQAVEALCGKRRNRAFDGDLVVVVVAVFGGCGEADWSCPSQETSPSY